MVQFPSIPSALMVVQKDGVLDTSIEETFVAVSIGEVDNSTGTAIPGLLWVLIYHRTLIDHRFHLL